MFELFLLGCAVGWVIYSITKGPKVLSEEDKVLAQKVLNSMAFVKVETVTADSGEVVFLGYDINTNKLLGQSVGLPELYSTIFKYFPQYEMLWANIEGDTLIPVQRPETEMRKKDLRRSKMPVTM